MSKVVFAADVHFGVPGRLNDIVFSCRVIREYCRSVGIDTVVILGDLFHDRRVLEIDVLSAACRFFEETAEYNQQWITFPGNHDMFLRHSWDINSLTPLRKHLTVIEDVKVLQLDNRRFWVLPFVQYEKAYMRVVRKIEEKFEPGDNLLTHVGIKGATLNTCFLLKDWSIVTFEYAPFDRIYTGHFHSKQQVGNNLWYPGSPIPFKFDEGDVPHGFYVYDTDENTHKFVNIWKAAEKLFPNETPPPQFCTILDEQISNLVETDVRNNMIRVALNRDYTLDEKRALKDKLTEMGARTVRWLNLAQKTNIEREKTPAHAENKDLFHAWLDSDNKGLKDLDKNVLIKAHDEIMLEGDELYSVEESESW